MEFIFFKHPHHEGYNGVQRDVPVQNQLSGIPEDNENNEDFPWEYAHEEIIEKDQT